MPIAEIRPAEPMSRWEELVAAGKVRFATKSGPLPFAPIHSDVSSQEILDDIRRDHS
ncbi:hypothetical protein GCM10028798_24590 [Humibacter antri]